MTIRPLQPYIVDKLVDDPNLVISDFKSAKLNDIDKYNMLLQFINNISIDDIKCTCNCSDNNPECHSSTCAIWLYDKLSKLITINIDILTRTDMSYTTLQALLSQLNIVISNILTGND